MTSSFKVFLLFMFASSYSAYSQTWEVGLTAGAMGYMGDLNQNKFYKLNHFAAGGVVKRNIDGYWSLKLSFLRGQISADDALSLNQQEKDRNLNFFSPISEGSLQMEFNFLDYGFGFGQKRVTPFLSAGISLAGFNPQTNYDGRTYQLKYYNTEGQSSYNTTTYAIPISTGLKYNFGRYLNIIGEVGFRSTSTDYLDDVSGEYADMSGFSPLRIALSDRSASKIGASGSQRGDFRKKDTYLFAGITLTYTFVSQKCPL
jgi:hypothetical protein